MWYFFFKKKEKAFHTHGCPSIRVVCLKRHLPQETKDILSKHDINSTTHENEYEDVVKLVFNRCQNTSSIIQDPQGDTTCVSGIVSYSDNLLTKAQKWSFGNVLSSGWVL